MNHHLFTQFLINRHVYGFQFFAAVDNARSNNFPHFYTRLLIFPAYLHLETDELSKPAIAEIYFLPCGATSYFSSYLCRFC
jgi:hypothetical protein